MLKCRTFVGAGGRNGHAYRRVPSQREAASRVVEERHLAHGPARVELLRVRDAEKRLTWTRIHCRVTKPKNL